MPRAKQQHSRPASYEAILHAAVAEYAAHGRDGVRMENVAKRAGVNKTLVYRHFKDRDALFDAALQDVFERRLQLLESLPEDPARLLSIWSRRFAKDPLFVRMLMREAIDADGPPAHAARRADYYARQIAGIERMQRDGNLPGGNDPAMLFLLLSACVVFPYVLPQIAALITGCAPESAAFQRRWKRQVLNILGNPPRAR
jgi:AcrR family transcriptional regulator